MSGSQPGDNGYEGPGVSGGAAQLPLQTSVRSEHHQTGDAGNVVLLTHRLPVGLIYVDFDADEVACQEVLHLLLRDNAALESLAHLAPGGAHQDKNPFLLVLGHRDACRQILSPLDIERRQPASFLLPGAFCATWLDGGESPRIASKDKLPSGDLLLGALRRCLANKSCRQKDKEHDGDSH